MIIESKVVRTEKRIQIELGFTVIRRLLEQEGVIIPSDAKITVQVPGGGDWSNTELDVDDKNPVVVEWVELDSAS
jgi:hypothetical protein